MTELEIYRLLVWTMFGSAVATFLYLLRRPAPYGRHYRGSGWGPTVSNRVGWIGMECPAVFLFLLKAGGMTMRDGKAGGGSLICLEKEVVGRAESLSWFAPFRRGIPHLDCGPQTRPFRAELGRLGQPPA